MLVIVIGGRKLERLLVELIWYSTHPQSQVKRTLRLRHRWVVVLVSLLLSITCYAWLAYCCQ